tara:strand:- start:2286 stop:2588 length:303 start_codon:yes stop_codon:yes gene_type:complete
MRLPSFIKLPNNRKFKFSARHYDPIKDDLDQRISRSKNTKKKYFNRNTSKSVSTSKLQLIIAFILSFLIFGWLYIGNKIFIFILLIPIWFFLKKISKKRG